ncbi:hypothetical protein V8C40DRAFT_20714 [Trichoderma camerunense]
MAAYGKHGIRYRLSGFGEPATPPWMAWTAQLMAVTILVGLPNSSSANASCFCLFGFSEYFGHGTVRHSRPTLDMQRTVAIASLCPRRHASRARIHRLRELINLTERGSGRMRAVWSAIYHIGRAGRPCSGPQGLFVCC